MNIKNISILSASILLVNNILPFTYAASNTKDSIGSINMEDDGVTIGVDETQSKKTTYSNEIKNEGLQGSDVYVSQASTFGVTIPKTIILDGKVNENNINKANYIVTISNESNFAGNERIKVIPETNFKMSQEGKNDINVSVLQDKEEWKYNELDVKGNGEISTNEISAGIWKGTFNFNIELNNNLSIFVEAFDKNGVNLNAIANEIKNEKRDLLLNSLVDIGIIENKNEINLLIDVNSDDFNNIATTTFNVSSFAKENDKVVILHFNEISNEWEYISTEIVNSEGKITSQFSSFSPVAFVKIDKEDIYENIVLPAGLYNENNSLLTTWENSGINDTCSNARTIIYNNYPTTSKVIIPKNITTISSYAFYNCNLTKIEISKNVSSIQESAFSMNYNLKQINIDSYNPNYCVINGVLFTKDLKTLVAYPNGKEDENYIIPNQVTKIEVDSFRYNQYLKSVTLSNNLSIIEKYSFANCSNLSNIIFNESITTINDYSFSNCVSLTNITIPQNIKTLKSTAFNHCSKLINININSNNQYYCSINGVVFNKTKENLIIFPNGRTNSYTIPNGTKTIIEHAFDSCQLETITFSNTITLIGPCAFWNSPNLKKVILSNTLETIGRQSFQNCDSLESIGKTGSNSSIEIPNSLKIIEHTSFADCDKLTKVEIPNNVTFVGNGAFNNTPWYDEQLAISPLIIVGNGILIEGKTAKGNITLPTTVKTITTSAFNGNKELTSVSITNNVTEIGIAAFASCENLQSIIIGSGVTTIYFNAFLNCKNLTSIIIPSNVNYIGPGAFNGTNLTSATFKNTSNWYIGSQEGKKETSLSSSKLSNTTTAATYLKSTYQNKHWSK